MSVGVVSYPDDGTNADELMISADGAMYTSKRGGKNRVTGVNMPADRPSTPPDAASERAVPTPGQGAAGRSV